MSPNVYNILEHCCTECILSKCDCTCFNDIEQGHCLITNVESISHTPSTTITDTIDCPNDVDNDIIDQTNSPCHQNLPSHDTQDDVINTSSQTRLKSPSKPFKFSHSGVHVASLNICHLLPKLDELKLHLLGSHAPDIFGLNETFLNESVIDSCLNIPNYVFERKDRVGKKGGGVLLYISDQLSYERRIDLESTGVESIWIQVNTIYTRPYLLCFVYRPPNVLTSWYDLFSLQIENADITNLHYFILGDMNINYSIADNCTFKFSCEKWATIVSNYGLAQLIKSPTRVTKTSTRTIDHIYTNASSFVKESFVSEISLSDHYPICFTYKTNNCNTNRASSEHQYISYRSFHSFSIDNFRQDLLSSDISMIETITDVNTAMSTFYDIINSVLNKHVPLKEKRVKRQKQPGWFNHEIKQLIKERDNSHKLCLHDKYKLLRNKVTSEIRKSKKNFFNKTIKCGKEPKQLWQGLKNISNLNQQNSIKFPKMLMVNNCKINDKQTMINELNRHFVNISSIINKSPMSKQYIDHLSCNISKHLGNAPSFTIDFITQYQVKTIIDKLGINKSTGLDNISPRVLKHCGDTIVPVITSIVNNSIASGVFPDELKLAKVIPLFKSGPREDPCNYRPISILPTISKIFERHMANQLNTYLSKYNILHKYQSGFRSKHSCNTALTRLIDTWLKEIDNGKIVGTVFLDLKKAFDLVDHNILLKKLELYRFSNLTLKLFASYLNNRKQVVQHGNLKSELMDIVSGVPQGSILGPLLFLIYINDIAFVCDNINIDLYADDNSLHETGYTLSEIETKLQFQLTKICVWCKENNMAINPQKTKCMTFGSKIKLKSISQLHLTIENHVLDSVRSEKSLGVILDNCLTWKDHIDSVCKRISSKIALLKRIVYFLNDEMKLLFYNAYILPYIDYCCTIWGKNKTHTKKIFTLQKRALRIITSGHEYSSTMQMFKENKVLTVFDRCKYHTAILVYKTLNNSVPSYMSEILSFSENSVYNLRSVSNNDLILSTRPNTNYMKDTFMYFSIDVWNSIPNHIKSLSLHSFKDKYKSSLIDMY